MVIGVKERKDKGDKFSDKIRRNFERFKDKVEGLGKKAIILGGVGIGIGLGCASKNDSIYSYYNVTSADSISLDEFRQYVYRGAVTREDSILGLGRFIYATWGFIPTEEELCTMPLLESQRIFAVYILMEYKYYKLLLEELENIRKEEESRKK
ncbi:MAG: hypothetical protein QXD51_01865 [Candidatus Anstonellales archaeon]